MTECEAGRTVTPVERKRQQARDRQARWRERQRCRRLVVMVEVDEPLVVEALAAEGFLDTDDRIGLSKALERVIATWARYRVTRCL